MLVIIGEGGGDSILLYDFWEFIYIVRWVSSLEIKEKILYVIGGGF